MAKKKTPDQRLAAQRRLRAKTRTRGASLRSTKPEDDLPPAEAVEAYQDAYSWAAANPEESAALMRLSEADLADLMEAMAFPERFPRSDQERREIAWRFRAWHILAGFKYTLDWPTPVACMTEDEIIAQLRVDAAANKL